MTRKFSSYLQLAVAFVILLFILMFTCRLSFKDTISSTTRVNNLEITGTTNATGLITANGGVTVASGNLTAMANTSLVGTTQMTGLATALSGIRLTTVGTGPIIISDALSPNGVVSSTKGSIFLRSDTAQLWQNTDGANTWSQLGSIGVGTLSIASASGSSVDVCTEGTIDFIAANSSLGNPPRVFATGANYSSKLGGWITQSFDWISAGNSMNMDTAGTGFNVSCSVQSAGKGTTIGTSAVKWRMYHLSSPTNGWGYRFTVPGVSSATRTLKVYAGHYSNVVRWNARLSDGTASDVFTDTDSGSGAFVDKTITVQYKCGAPTCDVIFRADVQSRYTSDPGIQFGAATVF